VGVDEQGGFLRGAGGRGGGEFLSHSPRALVSNGGGGRRH